LTFVKMTTVSSQKRTIRLVVPPQYHPLGYTEYTGTHDLSDSPSLLKLAGSRDGQLPGMTLLFRGRKISPEEEVMTFDTLMKKVWLC
jgi:hypothetical protein